jgi:hypothetical protein
MRRILLALLLLLCALAVPLCPVRADAGPKPSLTLRLYLDGQPLNTADAQVRLLSCLSRDETPYGSDKPLPGLDRLDLGDPSGCLWRDPGAMVRGGCSNGVCSFSGMLPQRFRAAVYLPAQDRLYVTGAALRQAMHERFAAELQVDGTAVLRADPLPLVGRNWSLPGMGVALLLTLVVELLAIVIYTRLTQRPLRRLLVVGLIANLVTLPGVWLMAGFGYLLLGVEAGLIVLAMAEGLAWLVEAAVYTVAGRISFGQALLLSLAANLASLILGLFVH